MCASISSDLGAGEGVNNGGTMAKMSFSALMVAGSSAYILYDAYSTVRRAELRAPSPRRRYCNLWKLCVKTLGTASFSKKAVCLFLSLFHRDFSFRNECL